MVDADQIIVLAGCITALFINSMLIYLTVYHVTFIKGTYKKMIIIFAFACILFDATEFLSRPHLHNFNGSLTYFSHNHIPENQIFFYVVFIDAYAGLYCSLITFVAIQFIFRYATLLGKRKLLSTFYGFQSMIWVPVVVVPGIVFCVMGMILMQPDEHSDGYIKEEFRQIYSRNIKQMARLILVAYDANKNIRWKNLSYCFVGSSILSFIYSVIIFCAVKMQINITKQLKHVSVRHRNLEMQFFKTIIIQIALPTIFLTFPMMPMLVIPIFDLEISFHSNIFYWALSLYPALDSIAVMFIVSEYRTCVRKILKCGSAVDASNPISTSNMHQISPAS
ncbi:hypothetical protein GCK72_018545 [Caenorhabditis remanei]|uniref:Seven TM Receptor n=1 Tax=Caenorhabditis remanei TaxID=31234 RepID=A0A6A5GA26_CAERE|nr:hypothetical protein GCK72_018542 [Caenorhabditis remanei]XP_053581526.1 hypothetical protein GCK72_018545 [Caenorhabditis remanei]KAF1751988.1 hypothetical protein GCK72_018542 [Caenorhabditis remanei]KAF1751991.1 hypothetical protein GCK72_018545 [Caenorhabditis remanei]